MPYHQDYFGLNDHRYMARAQRNLLEDFEEEYGVKLPTTWEVCHTCGGEGKHVNPDIDSHGLTAEDFYDDPDFAESYRSGVYDVRCYECKGRTTVRVVDEEALKFQDPELLAEWHSWQRSSYDSWAETLAERRMGA